MVLMRKLFFVAAMLAFAHACASDQSIADTLAKDGIKIKLDKNGIALSALFADGAARTVARTVAA